MVVRDRRVRSFDELAAHAYVFEIDLPGGLVDAHSQKSIGWHLRKDVFHERLMHQLAIYYSILAK